MEHELNISRSSGCRETGALAGACSIREAMTSIQSTLNRIGRCSIYLDLHVIPGYNHERNWVLDGNQEGELTQNNNNPATIPPTSDKEREIETDCHMFQHFLISTWQRKNCYWAIEQTQPLSRRGRSGNALEQGLCRNRCTNCSFKW